MNAPRKPNSSQPAGDIERIFGLDNIAGHYIFPENMDEESLESLVKESIPLCLCKVCMSKLGPGDAAQTNFNDLPKLQNLLQKFIALNPEIQHITYQADNMRHISDILCGIARGLHIDDIDFYINAGEHERKQYSSDIAALERRLSDISIEQFSYIHWVPSPQTLVRIHHALDTKNHPPFTPASASNTSGQIDYNAVPA